MSKIAENIEAGKDLDISDIEKIVDFLKTFADKCHHGKEETVLFPALVLAGVPNENGPIAVMLHEHTVGRGYIKEMSDGVEKYKTGHASAKPVLAGSLMNYVTLLQNHIQKEENVLFPMANRVLTGEKQDELFEQFERIEEDVVGHGVHEQYHELLDQLKRKYLS